VPAAVGLPLLLVILLLSRINTPVVHAEELLARAVASEKGDAPDAARRVRMHLERPFDNAAPYMIARAAVSLDDMPDELARALSRYPLNLEHPLSAGAFAKWHAGLTQPRDRVSVTRDGLLLLSVTTTDPILQRAVLVVQPVNYHPVRLTLEFSKVGLFEIEEIRPAGSETLVRAAVEPEATVSADDALDRAELEARLALRAADLDLGAIHVTRTATSIRVAGRLPERASSAIIKRLAALPGVEVSLPKGRDPDGESTAAIPAGALAQWLARSFADSNVRASFIPETTRLTRIVGQRLLALDTLARRYPETEVRRLSPAARAAFENLVTSHQEQLTKDVLNLKGRVTALVGAAPRRIPQAGATSNWRHRVTVAIPKARAVEADLHILLSHADLPPRERTRDGRSPLGTDFDALLSTLNTP
jgi:hypothetical protein